MEIKEGDIVLCTVDRIIGTIVFVKIQGNGEGSIILSEIAPGRIRNLRNYVVPKKKIFCKVLRILGDRIDLSLRRVTPKEQKEAKEQYKQEKSYESILSSLFGQKAKEFIEKIREKERLYDFLEEAKENPEKILEIFGKENSEKILEILKNQKQKSAILKKRISLTTKKPNGLEIIKEILKEINEAEITYISAGEYAIKIESSDLKTADKKLKSIFEKIEKKAKEKGAEFRIKEK